MNEFLDWLEGRRHDVSRLEAEGGKLLETGETDAYRAVMRKKAELLASLAEEGEPLAASLPSGLRKDVNHCLRRFSSSAEKALNLDSVFYMSALLYPEDHQPGQADDLDILVERIRAGLARK